MLSPLYTWSKGIINIELNWKWIHFTGISLILSPECSWSKSKIGLNWKWMHMGSLCGCVGTCDGCWVSVRVTVNTCKALKSNNNISPPPPPCHLFTHTHTHSPNTNLPSCLFCPLQSYMCAVSDNVLPFKELAMFPVSLTVGATLIWLLDPTLFSLIEGGIKYRV